MTIPLTSSCPCRGGLACPNGSSEGLNTDIVCFLDIIIIPEQVIWKHLYNPSSGMEKGTMYVTKRHQ